MTATLCIQVCPIINLVDIILTLDVSFWGSCTRFKALVSVINSIQLDHVTRDLFNQDISLCNGAIQIELGYNFFPIISIRWLIFLSYLCRIRPCMGTNLCIISRGDLTIEFLITWLVLLIPLIVGIFPWAVVSGEPSAIRSGHVETPSASPWERPKLSLIVGTTPPIPTKWSMIGFHMWTVAL